MENQEPDTKLIKDIRFSDAETQPKDISNKKPQDIKQVQVADNSKSPEKKLKPKGSRFKFCCFSCVILVILFVLGVVSAVAASGLMYIPGFSKVLYREPQPVRIVQPIEIDNVEDYFTQKFEDEYDKKGKDQKLSTAISEEELTAILQYTLGIGGKKSSRPEINDLQAAVSEKHVEFFGRIKRGPVNTVIILNIEPEIRDNELYLKPKELQAGALKLPFDWIFSITNLDEYINQPISIAKDIKIIDLELQDKQIKVELLFENIDETLSDPFSSQDASPYQSI
ncbi:MAG: hypothetical protein ABH837_00840 [bacterium]